MSNSKVIKKPTTSVRKATTHTKLISKIKPPEKRGTPPKPILNSEVKDPQKKSEKKAYSAEEIHNMICVAAYYIAEKNGFNQALTDWCWQEAKKQISEQELR